MKTGREAFEVWWKSIYRIPGEDMGVAWQAWQASRQVALEDAAKTCGDVLRDTYSILTHESCTYLQNTIKELK